MTPGRYVGIEEQQDDGEPFEEKMARLTSELSDLFVQSHKLEAEIKEKLGAIDMKSNGFQPIKDNEVRMSWNIKR